MERYQYYTIWIYGGINPDRKYSIWASSYRIALAQAETYFKLGL